MDESGMDPGSTPPAPSTHKYMSVPEKIELTSGGVRDGYSTGSEAWMDQSSYRPMNVPDMITLEQPIAAAEGRPSRETDQSQASRLITEGGGESRPQIQQMEPPNWPQEHQEPQAVVQESPAIANLDKRVRSLEQQVQRLRDIAGSRNGPGGEIRQGNNFWYVVTFAGWMMIPLIVMYMNRYRR